MGDQDLMMEIKLVRLMVFEWFFFQFLRMCIIEIDYEYRICI